MGIDQRTLDMQQIAIDIEKMVNRNIVDHITIVYVEMTEKVRKEDKQLQRFLEDKQLQRFLVVNGDEYFMISRAGTLLYVVNVSADNCLTAAYELMELIRRKF